MFISNVIYLIGIFVIFGLAILISLGRGLIDSIKVNLYTKKHPLNPYLKNEFIECRLINKNGKNEIYCKEKYNDCGHNCFLEGRLMKIKSANSRVTWIMLQMNFTRDFVYSNLMETFPVGEYITNSKTKYNTKFIEINGYPFIPNEAQNEMCRMVLDEKKCEIFCYEIWAKNPKSFYIRGNLKSLRNILEKLRADKNSFRTLKELEEIYGQMAENLEKVDINNADLDEIQKIKGINIIVAKRILKKREEIGGFNSVNDVVIFSRLKSHAAEMLREQIEIKPIKISPAQIRHEERNVDL